MKKQTASLGAEMCREIGMYAARRKRIVEYGGKKSAAERRFTVHPNAVSVTRCLGCRKLAMTFVYLRQDDDFIAPDK